MSLSASERRNMYNGLETALGLETAETLMKLLPYHPADQLVTRADMHAQTLALKAEITGVRSELKGDMAGLRTEFGELRTELKGDMAELKTELKGEMTELKSELKGDILGLENRFEQRFTHLQVSTQRLVTASIAANTVAVVTALIT